MSANFFPELSGYSGQEPFRFWCQTVLPTIYDDSLSYYELLNKVVNVLNTCIGDISNLEDNTSALARAYSELQNYVNHYFDNVNLQEEINNKLNEMAEDGSLEEIITPTVIGTVNTWLDENVIIPEGGAVTLDPTLNSPNAAAPALTVKQKCYTKYDKGTSELTPFNMPDNSYAFVSANDIVADFKPSGYTEEILSVWKTTYTARRFDFICYSQATKVLIIKSAIYNNDSWNINDAVYMEPYYHANVALTVFSYPDTIDSSNPYNLKNMPANRYMNIPLNYIENAPTDSIENALVLCYGINPSRTSKKFIIISQYGTKWENFNRYDGDLNNWERSDCIEKTKLSSYNWEYPTTINDNPISATNRLDLQTMPKNSWCNIYLDYINPSPENRHVYARVECVNINANLNRLYKIISDRGYIYIARCENDVFSDWESVSSVSNVYITATNRESYFIDANNAPNNSIYAISKAAKIINTPYGNSTTNNSFSTNTAVPDWESNTNYLKGDFSTYNNSIYQCITAHTSTTAFDSSKWSLCEWDSTKTYNVNDIAIYNDKYYYCVKQCTNVTPTTLEYWKPSYEIPNRRTYTGFFDGTLITYGSTNNNNIYKHQTFICGVRAGSSLGYVSPSCNVYTRTGFSTGWSDWQISSNNANLHTTNIVLMKKLLAPYLTAPFGDNECEPCAHPTQYKNPMHINSDLYIRDLNDAKPNTVYQIDLDAVGDYDGDTYYELLAHNPIPGVSGLVITTCWSELGAHALVQMYFGLSANFINMKYRYMYRQSATQVVWTPWRAASPTRFTSPSTAGAKITLATLPDEWSYYGKLNKVADFDTGGIFADAPFELGETYGLIEKIKLVSTDNQTGLYTISTANFKYQCWRASTGSTWIQLNTTI